LQRGNPDRLLVELSILDTMGRDKMSMPPSRAMFEARDEQSPTYSRIGIPRLADG